MIEVPLDRHWSRRVTPDDLFKPFKEIGIEEWDFKIKDAKPIMLFKRSEDALAFKIRYGI